MKFLTRTEVSKQLNISLRSVDRLISRGQLKALKIGRSIRISQEQLDELIKLSYYDPLMPKEVSISTEFSI